jgi:hypothetical protein
MNTAGFYKLDGDLLYAPNFVVNANYELYADNPEDRLREVDGWKWFDTEAEAIAYYGL